MHSFLIAHSAELIARCRQKVAQRRATKAGDAELEHGIPLFLNQLIKTLQIEQTSEPLYSRKVSGPAAAA